MTETSAQIERDHQLLVTRITLIVTDTAFREIKPLAENLIVVENTDTPRTKEETWHLMGPKESLSNFFARMAIVCARAEATAQERRANPPRRRSS